MLSCERMTDSIHPGRIDSNRLQEVNLELGRLARKHHACRMNSFTFSAVAAVTLAISVLGLIHILPTGESDWTRNPDSPVYAVAVKQKPASMLEAGLVAGGFLLSLWLVYRARTQCSRQRRLWQKEADLRTEMRGLRDELYVENRPGAGRNVLPHRQVGRSAPFDSDATKGTHGRNYRPPARYG
jgi:hypothetical protein